MKYDVETTYGYVKDGKVYLKGYLNHPDREIGFVRETPEAAIAYFENRYQLAVQKVNELYQQIEEATNKGSFLMKLLHMRQYLLSFNGLGDFPALLRRLDEMELYLRELIAQNRIKNLEIKREILKELEDIAQQQTNWKVNSEKVQDLKMRWIRTGPVDDLYAQELEDRFNAAIKLFFTNRKNFFQGKRKEEKAKVEQYRLLIQEVNELKYSNDFEQVAEHIKNIQQKWKDVGKVSHKRMVKLWKRFQKVTHEFFYRYKQYKEGVPIDNIQPLNMDEFIRVRQADYCRQMEALIGINSDESLQKAKHLLAEWKKLVQDPRLIDKALARQFRLISDRVFEEGYLMRVIRRKYPDFDFKPEEEQLKIKISFLRETIRRDEQEIAEAEAHPEKVQIYKPNFNARTQQRKVMVKKVMLREFEQRLRIVLGEEEQDNNFKYLS